MLQTLVLKYWMMVITVQSKIPYMVCHNSRTRDEA